MRGDKIDDKNSITIKSMYKTISYSSEYKELTTRQKRTYNEKALKKWVENEFQIFTPRNKGERIIGLVRKPYEDDNDVDEYVDGV